jgi:hypothetical protein
MLDGSKDDILAADLRALHERSLRDMPPLETLEQVNPVRGRSPRTFPGGILMKTLWKMKSRPWLTTLGGAAAVALALLVVPISYQRTVGQDVTIEITSPETAVQQISLIAQELKSALHAPEVMVTQQAGSARQIVLNAFVPLRGRESTLKLARAFARGLFSRGIPATAEVRPRIETVSGSVYAMAQNVIEIRVDREGKTAEQLEREIMGQLEAAGIHDTSVNVTTDGNKTQIQVMTECVPESCADHPQVNVELNPPPPDGGHRAEVRVRRTPEMTDADVIAEIQRQLREQGQDADVSIVDGEIQIRPRN